MSKFLVFFFLSLNLFALSNKVTIRDRSGANQADRTVTIPRYFAEGEITGYPQPRINGAPAVEWQSDVKTRWPDGSVRLALVSVELNVPGCPGASCKSTEVDFVSTDKPSSDGAGLTRDEMLSFRVGVSPGRKGYLATRLWGAKIQAAINGLNKSASARDMIAKGFYTVLESGPLRHSVLVRESGGTRTTSFGFQCVGVCRAPYDASTSTWIDAGADRSHDSIRPSFVVTFYPRWKQVEVDYILDNGWFDRFQDQRLRLTLLDGGDETNAWYDSGVEIVLPCRGRIWEDHASMASAAISMDLNFPYMIYSKLIPQFDLQAKVGPAAVAAEVAEFNSTDRGATVGGQTSHLGWGQWQRTFGAGGGRPDLGLFPRWTVRYLYTFDPGLLNAVVGNAKAMMHAPMQLIEPDSSRSLDTAGAGGFGRVVSINSHLTLRVGPSREGDSIPADKPQYGGPVTCYGTAVPFCGIYDTNNPSNQWAPDISHQPNAFMVPYVVTGKYVFLEELHFWASFNISWGAAQLPPDINVGRRQSWGYINNTVEERAFAWGLRELAHAALLSWDSTPEKNYFTEKMNYNLAIWEGKLNILNGKFPPPDVNAPNRGCSTPFDAMRETSPWCMGRKFFANDEEDPLFFGVKPFGVGGSLVGIDPSKSGSGGSPWMQNYIRLVFGHIRDLGLGADKVHTALVSNLVHQFLDSHYSPYLITEYRIGVGDPANKGFLKTYAAVRDAYQMSALLSVPVSPNDRNIYVASLEGIDGNPLFAGNTKGLVRIGSEIIRFSGDSTIAINYTADPDTDLLTVPNRNAFANGQVVRVLGGLMAAPLKVNVDYYVVNAGTNTLQLSLDGQTPLDLTSAGNPGQAIYLTQLYVDTSPDCPNSLCRGMMGTTPSAHPAGDILSRFPGMIPTDYNQNVEHGYSWIARAAISYAAGYNVNAIDEGNGSELTGQAAWEWAKANITSDRIGANRASCGNLVNSLCDNPQWAIVPRLSQQELETLATQPAPENSTAERLLNANR